MTDCLFCKMVAGEIKPDVVYEDDDVLAFRDVNPQAPVHVLVIPKGEYVSQDDFSREAPAELIAGFWRAVGTVARELGLVEGGYRLLANTGADAHQEVPHFHVHIFGGKDLGRMIKPPEK